MSNGKSFDEGEQDPAAERDSQAMGKSLRSDVASWRAARTEELERGPTLPVPITKPASANAGTANAAARAKTAKPKPAPADAAAKKKPFGMAYDGMSQADYITYRISRGAR